MFALFKYPAKSDIMLQINDLGFAMTTLTHERVRELFDYNPNTGVFIRRDQTYVRARKRVGRNRSKYQTVNIGGKVCYAHRLIWLWMTGRWPSAEIDHVDRDGRNNMWSNLREATSAENKHNRPPKGRWPKGVGFYPPTGRWFARVRKDGRMLYLGYFGTPDEAHQAYLAAAQRLYGAFAVGA